MATLDDRLLGEKLDYYCSSSEDEDDSYSKSSNQNSSNNQPPSQPWTGESTNVSSLPVNS